MHQIPNTTGKPTHTASSIPILFHALDGMGRTIIALKGDSGLLQVAVAAYDSIDSYARVGYDPLHDWTTYVRR